jgi:hypothetical protein
MLKVSNNHLFKIVTIYLSNYYDTINIIYSQSHIIKTVNLPAEMHYVIIYID